MSPIAFRIAGMQTLASNVYIKFKQGSFIVLFFSSLKYYLRTFLLCRSKHYLILSSYGTYGMCAFVWSMWWRVCMWIAATGVVGECA